LRQIEVKPNHQAVGRLGAHAIQGEPPTNNHDHAEPFTEHL
jgi:hypothetical protein